MDRKLFLKTSCALCGLAGAVAFIESCKKNKMSTTPQGPTVNFTLDLSQPANASLNTSGNSLASQGVIIVNMGGAYIAIAEACTHAGCNITYAKSSNNFVCPCHGGTFDTNGKVTGGPPLAPLKKYTVTQSGTILTIAG